MFNIFEKNRENKKTGTHVICKCLFSLYSLVAGARFNQKEDIMSEYAPKPYKAEMSL